MSEQPNPYAAPQAIETPPPIATEEEMALAAIRRRYLNHEVAIEGLGMMLYMVGGLVALCGAAGVAIALLIPDKLAKQPGSVVYALGVTLAAMACFAVGLGLHHLRRWACWPLAGLTVLLAIVAFPVGTIIAVPTLWLLFGRSGRTVLSSDYHQIIAQTSRVRKSSPWMVRLVMIVLLTVVGLVILVPLTTP